MKKIIIGLVGPISCGKGFLGEYLANRGFFYTSTSDRVREEADRRGLPRVRKTLQDIGNELRATFGLSILVERSLLLIPEEAKLVVVDGIRNPGEVLFVKNQMAGVIIGVDAPVELRLKWYLARAKRRGEDGVTEADFWLTNNRDLGIGEDPMGQQSRATFAMSDHVLYNDGTDRMVQECTELLREKFGVNLEGKRKSKEEY